MSAPAKFTFNQDFGAPRTAKPTIDLAAHEAKLMEAEATGRRAGVEAGKAEARTAAEQRAAAALERIAAAAEALIGGLAAVEARLETEAVEVAVAVAKKLAAALIERESFAEMAALASGCFRHLTNSPHVVVRVNDAEHALLAGRIEELARRLGVTSQLVVLGEPGIRTGDCRIEWADGGVVRDEEAIAAAIDEAVTRYITARLAAAGVPQASRRADP
jgi:flagellar assembly protein FliH